MRVLIMGVVGVVVLGLSALPAGADTVELDLFTLGCPSTYDHNSPSWTSDFDLGVTFSQIDHVYMDWSGEITAGLAIDYSDPCNPFPLDVAISSYLDMPVHALSSMWGGEANYPAPEPFDSQSDFRIWGSWSGLLDGQGTIWLFYEGLIISEGDYIESGSIVLDRANLIVEGVIPEPLTLYFLGLGGFWITRKSQKYSRS